MDLEQPFAQFLAMFREIQMTKEVSVVLKTKQKNTIYSFNEALCGKCQRLMTPHGFHVDKLFSVRYEILNILHNGVYTSSDDFYINLSFQGCTYSFAIDLFPNIQHANIKLTEIQLENQDTYYLTSEFHDSPYTYLLPIIKNMVEVLKIFIHTSFTITETSFYLN